MFLIILAALRQLDQVSIALGLHKISTSLRYTTLHYTTLNMNDICDFILILTHPHDSAETVICNFVIGSGGRRP